MKNRGNKASGQVNHLISRYTYRMFWSEEDQEFVGTCLELPSLSGLANDQEQALVEIRNVVRASLEWMLEEGEQPPERLRLMSQSTSISYRRSVEFTVTHPRLSPGLNLVHGAQTHRPAKLRRPDHRRRPAP
jgi:predicted RNase H-like HicB family nuclease